MARLRILITAGPTREYIDPVRYISNDSSGKMGVALAQAAHRRGHRVTLVHGPLAVAAAQLVSTVAVVSAADMLAVCQRAWPKHDVLIMAAAVADYTPAHPARHKHKKDKPGLILRLKSTTDILATLSAARRADQIVIGFALEDQNERANAESKLRRKNLDAIILNRPEAIGADRAQVEVLIRDAGWSTLRAASKTALAARLIRLVEMLHR